MEDLMITRALTVAAVATGLAIPAAAADLPQSGSFTIHSGWKGMGETTQIMEKHAYGAGTFWGVSYNDAGSGPLHIGPALCTYVSVMVDGAATSQGNCAWSDTDGDKIFTDYSGNFTSAGFAGMNTITGGTGKYSGIQGKAPFQCRALNDKGQLSCTQQFDYQLTVATGTSTPPHTGSSTSGNK